MAGLHIDRQFTTKGKSPYIGIAWDRRDSRIANPDGSVVFEQTGVEVPSSWSQVATDIIVSKYFRRAGVPTFDDEGNQVLGGEWSARQVFDRLASTWQFWGESLGYFDSPDDSDAFVDEIKYMLATQMGSPNSPQWFNTGLNYEYGLTGPAQGFWYIDPYTKTAVESPDAYSRPSTSACFINSVKDDLVNPGGIMDLWTREARLFKFGSGTGTNFSTLRATDEPLSGGGKSSGVISFLKIGDRAAGAIKSGGMTRRAAKMVILDVDHPDIEEFIDWKKGEEEKAKILIQSGKYPADFNGEAYATVSGQNSNNSIRVTNEFVQAVIDDGPWDLIERSTGKVRKTVRARDLWRQIAEAAWACADPGIQFDTIINEWHTSPAGGKINATNPCSEYVFLDDTACNLASLNLVKFVDVEGEFDVETFTHAVRLWTIVLEISVAMSQFPSEAIAWGAYWYRTLGLGYANLGSLLMRWGIPYDSDEGRGIAGAITAILTGTAYATSAEMASVLGPFPKFEENRDAMLRVIRNHRWAALNGAQENYEGISHHVMGLDPDYVPEYLLTAAHMAWDDALDFGDIYGYRNAQVSVIAPTGTIGLQMDCDTTGVEPDFSLVKFKKLSGGGYFKIVNQSVAPALETLGYSNEQISDILAYINDYQMIEGAYHLRPEHIPVFDTANKNGKLGKRFIHHTGHIKMMAAVQPFISGATSKTINLPNEATVADIEESYMLSWELGVKCMALYRDGSKASQPLSSTSDDGDTSPEDTDEVVNATETEMQIAWGTIPPGMSPTEAYTRGMPPPRFLLPTRRNGFNQEAKIGGQKVYLHTGEYEDGTLGEIFIDLAKEGATLKGVLACFAIAVSKGLQYGVPLQEFVDTFTFQTFEPRGIVEGHPNIKLANSIVDYVFRALGVEYLQLDDLAQVPPDRSETHTNYVEYKASRNTALTSPPRPVIVPTVTENPEVDIMDAALAEMMGDAPLCDICGYTTVRNGSCYKCLNCGNSLGCS